MPRNQVTAVRGDVDHPTVLLLGNLTNRRGLMVSAVWMSVTFLGGSATMPIVSVHPGPDAMFADHGISSAMPNRLDLTDTDQLTALIPPAVDTARHMMEEQFDIARKDAEKKVDDWLTRVDRWTREADALTQYSSLKQRRVGVEEERRLAAERLPDRHLVRPLVVVVPQSDAAVPNPSVRGVTRGRQ